MFFGHNTWKQLLFLLLPISFRGRGGVLMAITGTREQECSLLTTVRKREFQQVQFVWLGPSLIFWVQISLASTLHHFSKFIIVQIYSKYSPTPTPKEKKEEEPLLWPIETQWQDKEIHPFPKRSTNLLFSKYLDNETCLCVLMVCIAVGGRIGEEQTRQQAMVCIS